MSFKLLDLSTGREDTGQAVLVCMLLGQDVYLLYLLFDTVCVGSLIYKLKSP